MATPASIAVTEGSGKNIATYEITETTTKELQRMVVSNSAGVEIGSGAQTEDVASASGDQGSFALTIRRGSGALSSSPTSTVGDYQEVASDDYGGVRMAILGKTANPTAASDGNNVVPLADKLGKLITVGSIRDLKVNQVTTITSSTAETTILTAVASTFLDLYGLIITNTSATAVNVALKDSTSGTTQLNIAVPAGDTRGFMLPEGAAIKQGTVNNNWTATSSGSIASLVITALAVKNI